MSKAERTDTQIREMRFRLFSEQSGRCLSCGEPVAITTMELAHRIPNRKWTVKLFGEEVIHHRKNFWGTHPGRCNSKAQLNPDSVYAEDLAREIQRDIKRSRDRRYAR
jgi:5-methylcytosine-specific restriction endonuclease McrA